FNIASLASTSATRPLVSTIPRASITLAMIEFSEKKKLCISTADCTLPSAKSQIRNPKFTSLVFASAGFGLHQVDARRFLQIDCVTLVGVEMHLELDVLAGTDQKVFEDRRTSSRFDPQVHPLAVLDSIRFQVGWAHVNVPLGADYAGGQLDYPLGAHKNAPGRIVMIAAAAHRQVDPQ